MKNPPEFNPSGSPTGQADPASPAVPVAVPDHELIRRIGRGSYGEVWLARNIMGQYRAIKIVHRSAFGNARPYERELLGIRAFEPVSRTHEGFVDVLHIGINEAQGYFYYVMELGDDLSGGQDVQPDTYLPKTLAKAVAQQGRLPVRDCLQLGLAITQALEALHKHGLVHRDVKPSNIIFVNGVAKLADIGLVAETSEARSYVGTEGFIPPEGPGAAQADLYSLGKTLYEASTGRDRHHFPELPEHLDVFPDLQELMELNEVVLRACQGEKEHRYGSAWAMHADLLVIANGRSVKRLKQLERRVTQFKRVAALVGVAGLVVTAMAYPAYQAWKNRIEALQRRIGGNVANGNHAMQSGDLLGALPYFAEAMRLDQGNRDGDATHRLRIGSVLDQCPKLTQVWSGSNGVFRSEFSPDGRKALRCDYHGYLRLYDFATGEPCAPPFRQSPWTTFATFSNDGRQIATSGDDGQVWIWNADPPATNAFYPHPTIVNSARFSPDDRRLATACSDGFARVWNLRTHRLEFQCKHDSRVRYADFSHDGLLLVTTGDDGATRIWDASDGHLLKTLPHPSWVFCAAFSPDDQKIVTACADHKARVWSTATGQRLLPDLRHGDGVPSAQFSPDGRYILTACWDGTAYLWDAESQLPLTANPMLKQGERLRHAAFAPDGHRIMVAGDDGTVRVWDLAGAALEPRPVPCCFSQDGSRFLIVTNQTLEIRDTRSGDQAGPVIALEGTVIQAQLSDNHLFASALVETPAPPGALLQVWEVATGRPAGSGILLSNTSTGVALSSDGRQVLTFSGNQAQVWDTANGSALSPPLPHRGPIDSAFFDPGGAHVATYGGQFIQVWETRTGQPCYPAFDLSQPVRHAEFSADGSKLAGCCWDAKFTKCYAQVWEVATGRPIGPPLRHGDGVDAVSFSPDGRRVATGSEDYTAIIWDVAAGKPLIPPITHEDQIRAVAFSPDGRWLATASMDRSARLWNAETGDPLTPPLRHLDGVTNVLFLADLHHLVTQDNLARQRIWALPSEERPLEDVQLLSRLLSASASAKFNSLASAGSESIESLWRRLRGKYPDTFAVSGAEIERWHEAQAEESERNHQWFAAAFHLQTLAKLRPADPVVAARLATTKSHLSNEN